MQPLETHVSDLPLLDVRQNVQQCRYERYEVRQAVAAGAKHDDAQSDRGNVLLVLQIAVGSQQHREAGGRRCPQKVPVFQARSSTTQHDLDHVPGQRRVEIVRQ